MLQRDRHDAVRGLDTDGPGASAADGDIAAGVDETGPGGGEDVGGALGCVALADPAQIEPGAVFELDASAYDGHASAAGR